MKFIAILGIFVSLLMAFLISSNRKKIKIKPIIFMIAIQFILAFIILNTSFGMSIIGHFTKIFDALMSYAMTGVSFVFGGLASNGQFIFFFNVLLPIIFISTLIGILQHFKILPIIINAIGFVLGKINGLAKLESYNAIAAAILGQNEVWISVKKQLGALPEHRLYIMCASAMSTVSLSIIGAYMKIIEPKYVFTAMALNLFGGFIIASIINPYDVPKHEDLLELNSEHKQSFFEMLGEYIIDGFKIAIIVSAMLIGFVALISLINGICLNLFGITFQAILGYVFSPFAYIMGIPSKDILNAGNIMATKLVTNEFVAMIDLKNMTSLTSRSVGIISVFLVSFANFTSIGIISGAIKGLNEKQSNVAARFGLKLLYGASLVSILSATITGVFIN